MADEQATAPRWRATSAEQAMRWAELLGSLTRLVPDGAPRIVVDGPPGLTATVADRLAGALRDTGRPALRLSDENPLGDEDAWFTAATPQTVTVAEGPRWREQASWDLVVWLRTAARNGRGDGERGAGVVLDLHDEDWPVIRHVDARIAGPGQWYLAESRAFFAARASTWDAKFGADLPAYAAAVAEARLPTGGIVLDVGCGTGRALSALREAAGPTGTVLGIDLTPQMLDTGRALGHADHAALILGDASRLPVATGAADAVFAAGLLTHLPDTDAGLRELARVTRSGGRLVLFHPSGRAALAARHGRTLRPGEPLAEDPLRTSLTSTGWHLDTYDDAPHRFYATATRS